MTGRYSYICWKPFRHSYNVFRYSCFGCLVFALALAASTMADRTISRNIIHTHKGLPKRPQLYEPTDISLIFAPRNGWIKKKTRKIQEILLPPIWARCECELVYFFLWQLIWWLLNDLNFGIFHVLFRVSRSAVTRSFHLKCIAITFSCMPFISSFSFLSFCNWKLSSWTLLISFYLLIFIDNIM